MNTLSSSSTFSPSLPATLPVLGVGPASLFDAPRHEASRDNAAPDSATATAGEPVRPDRAAELYRAVRRRPQLAAGAVAALTLAVGTLLWSQYGRGILAVGSGYAVERLFGARLSRRVSRLLLRGKRRR